LSSIFASLFGSSNHVSAGPTNGIALLVAGAVAARPGGLAPEAMLFTLTFLVGAIQAGLGLLRAGAFVNYVSKPVLVGYMTAAGLLIGWNQIPNLLGIPSAAQPGFAGTFEQIRLHISGTNPAGLAVGLLALGVVIACRLVSRRWPGMLLALAAGGALTLLLGAGAGIRTVGGLQAIPQSLPPFAPPPLDPARIQPLLGIALAIAILGLTEAFSIARTIALKSGQALNPSQDFLGLGAANLASSFFHGMPGSGSLTRSMVCYESGGRTRLSGLFTGISTLILVVAFAPLANRIPIPALAGVLLFVAWTLFDVRELGAIFRSTPSDVATFLLTFGLAIAFPSQLDKAVLAGVALSVLSFVRQASSLNAREMGTSGAGQFREIEAREEGCPQISLLHVEGSLFFGAAYELDSLLRDLAARPGLRVIILRTKRIQNIDMDGLHVLRGFALAFRAKGGTFLLCGVRPELKVRLDRLGLTEAIGAQNVFLSGDDVFASTQEAIRRALELLGPHGCSCTARASRECFRAGGDAPS
ncbi:MAG: SulP family inorganic anion transporter, partial [Planctomycetota bacterium]